MRTARALREGQILNGPMVSEHMLVETVRKNGTRVWVAGLVGRRSERGSKAQSDDQILPQQATKDPFVLESLGLKDEHSESDFEGRTTPPVSHGEISSSITVEPPGAAATDHTP